MISTHITIWLSLVILAFHYCTTIEHNHTQQRAAFLNLVNTPSWRRRSKTRRNRIARANTRH